MLKLADGNDLGKIVSLIMENPKLIEEISNLAKGKQREDECAVSDAEPADSEAKESAPASVKPSASTPPRSGRNRSQLLGALKAYVSVERAQAIDSMLSIVEILDAMKGR